jgi:hypothetical protein
MTKLAALMEWLSLRDAARYLSEKLEDDITEASILPSSQSTEGARSAFLFGMKAADGNGYLPTTQSNARNPRLI